MRRLALVVPLFFSLVLLLGGFLTFEHARENSPYIWVSATVLEYQSGCESSGRLPSKYTYLLIASIDGNVYKNADPFIGFYPFQACVLGENFSLLDYKRLSELKKGASVEVIVDKNKQIYLGYMHVKKYLFFSLFFFAIFLFVFFYHRRLMD